MFLDWKPILTPIGFVEDSEVNRVFLLKHLELFFQAVYATYIHLDRTFEQEFLSAVKNLNSKL